MKILTHAQWCAIDAREKAVEAARSSLRDVIDEAYADAKAERAKCEVLERQTASQHTLISFLCARVNHLEKLNAVMFKHITSLDVPVPAIAPAPIEHQDLDLSEALAGGLNSSLFEDMGDEAARRHGIDWDREGRAIPVGRSK